YANSNDQKGTAVSLARPLTRRYGCLIALGLCLATDCLAAAQDARLAAAIPGIESAIRHSGAEVAVAFRTLDGRSEWLLHADEPFHAASTMKVAVLVELYRQVHQGKVRLDETLTIKNQFRSLVDGSPYTLDPNDDSETALYQAVGGT